MVLTVVALALSAAPSLGLPAFPGAEGFGSDTVGGRGGRVVEVTNLSDSGPGSLRAACEEKRPRTVVFRVGGTIRLKSRLRVREPFITIAGQTAPGGGILLRDAGLFIETHDVVVRHLRVRVGESRVEGSGAQDCVNISAHDPGETYSVVVDHCSFSWSIDEVGDAYGPVSNITFQWCIFAEGLRNSIHHKGSHSMGLLLGKNVSRTVHHCLLASNNTRNPRIGGGVADFENNVIYNWGGTCCWPSGNPHVNFIGNYYKPGPDSRLTERQIVGTDVGSIYVNGNITPYRSNEGIPDWAVVQSDIAESAHRAASRFDAPPITVQPALTAYRMILEGAGATLPVRDAVDRRIVREVRARKGRIIDNPDQVGGFPEIAGGEAPPDRDHDGMPDSWEVARSLDPGDPSDSAGDRDGDGYSNLEECINGLASCRP